jgi:ABC-type branched-subunit amino acid transport system substrate-binding protein
VNAEIGILAPITGPAASIGQEQLNFGKLALEDFNKAPTFHQTQLLEIRIYTR